MIVIIAIRITNIATTTAIIIITFIVIIIVIPVITNSKLDTQWSTELTLCPTQAEGDARSWTRWDYSSHTTADIITHNTTTTTTPTNITTNNTNTTTTPKLDQWNLFSVVTRYWRIRMGLIQERYGLCAYLLGRLTPMTAQKQRWSIPPYSSS